MIIKEHTWCYERLSQYIKEEFLILGNQESLVGNIEDFFKVKSYKTLDLDNGDYKIDLTSDISHLEETFDTVFNIGTLEHIWDTHTAYSNAARLVKQNGYFLSVGPVSGWENHGIHITSSWAILSFFQNNGFEILDNWLIDKTYQETKFTKKNKGRDIELWFAAKRIEINKPFVPPTQIFKNNKPVNL